MSTCHMLKKDRGKQGCEVKQLKVRIAEVAIAVALVVQAGSEDRGGFCCNTAMAELITEGQYFSHMEAYVHRTLDIFR